MTFNDKIYDTKPMKDICKDETFYEKDLIEMSSKGQVFC